MDTIIKAILIQAVGAAIYRYFLEKETAFAWNRLFLLLVIPFSFAAAHFQWVFSQEPSLIFENLQPVYIKTVKNFGNSPIKISGYAHWLFILYATGVILAAGIRLVRYWQLVRFIRQGKTVRKYAGVKIILAKDLNNAFNSGKNIVIDENLYRLNPLPVLEHEWQHIKLGHRYDLWIYELYGILFWFDPWVPHFKKKLVELHEYQADKYSKKALDPEYFQMILQLKFNDRAVNFLNTFYQSSNIKKRMLMKTKQKTSKSALLKPAGAFLLLLILALTFNACENDLKQTAKNLTTEQTAKTVNFQLSDEPPAYPGCEKLHGNDRKICSSKKIQEFLIKHLNVDTLKTVSKAGEKIKINVFFTISEDGNVENIKVRSKNHLAAQEVKKILPQLPQFFPGMQNGEPVKVNFYLPVVIQIDEDKTKQEK